MKTTIAIQNLKCGGCAATIREKVSKMDAVETVEVNEEESLVTVSHTDELPITTLKEKLGALGYPAVDDKNDLLTKAKSFVSCAAGRMSKA